MSFLKKLIPTALSLIPGVGGIASTVVGKLLDGGRGEGEELRNMVQQERDTAKSRKLTGEATDLSREAAQFGRDEFALDAPLRESFRAGALDFSDPTNVFGGGGNQAGTTTFNPGEIPPESASGISAQASGLRGSLPLSLLRGPAVPGAGGGGGGFAGGGGGGRGGVPGIVGGVGGMVGNIIQKLLASSGQRALRGDSPIGPGFTPSTGLGGTGGFTPPSPTIGGSAEIAAGLPQSETGSIASRVASKLGGGADFQRRFGTQERGSSTDFLTPSRRASGIKRSVNQESF